MGVPQGRRVDGGEGAAVGLAVNIARDLETNGGLDVGAGMGASWPAVVPTNRARAERADARAAKALGDLRVNDLGAASSPPAGSGLPHTRRASRAESPR